MTTTATEIIMNTTTSTAEIVKALKTYATANPITGDAATIDTLRARFAAFKASATARAKAAEDAAQRAAQRRADMEAVRARAMLEAARALIDGKPAIAIAEQLGNTTTQGPYAWAELVSFARQILESGQRGELAAWLAVELERPVPAWREA